MSDPTTERRGFSLTASYEGADTVMYFNGEPYQYQVRGGAPWIPFEGPRVAEWLKATGVEMYG